MAVYKDKKRGTWYVSLYYTDWTGKQQRKLMRGFSTKKEAQDWERHFSLEKASSLDMTFGDFYKRYTDDVKPKLRENTWKSKEYVIELKILPYFKDLVMREITPRDVIAWQNEMRCFYESTDYESFMRNIYSLPCDSDTFGAIAGGVAEEFYHGFGDIDAQGIFKKHLSDDLYEILMR